MTLKPLRGKVFVHNFKKGERMVGSIVLINDDGKGHGIRPRWAQVLETADNITGVKKVCNNKIVNKNNLILFIFMFINLFKIFIN